MLPDFPLASWEVPPSSDVPLVASADSVLNGVWRGWETQILVRHIQVGDGLHTYFREATSDEVGNWLIPHELVAYWFNKKRPYFSEYLAYFKRRFYFDGAPFSFPRCHELSVDVVKGEWCSENKKTSFKMPSQSNEWFFSCRSSEVGRKVKDWLNDPNSQTRFAFDWLHLSEEQKQSHILQISTEDLGKMKTLMRHVLLLNETKFRVWVIAEKTQLQWLEEDYPGDSYVYWDEEDISSGENAPWRLQKWKLVLWRHFMPSVDAKLLERARRVDEQANELQAIRVLVSEPPSAHEVLESHLALRDWWMNEGAPREFARLAEP